MQRTIRLLSWCGLLVGTIFPLNAMAGVEVTAGPLEQFTDVKVEGRPEALVIRPLKDALVLWAKALPEGQTLALDFTDIDLAGQMEPLGDTMDFKRVLRRSTPPRLALTYQLKDAEGHVLRNGQVTLQDPNYLDTPVGLQSQADPLRYEIRMLRQWFEREFVHPAH